jgi:hypothetical protein
MDGIDQVRFKVDPALAGRTMEHVRR